MNSLLKKKLQGILLCIAVLPALAQESPRNRLSLNDGWKFQLGHAIDAGRDFNYHTTRLFAKTAEVAGTPMDTHFDDSAWTPVKVPHDWAVTLPFVNVDDDQVMLHGYKAIGPLFPEHSIGWYRKRFDVDDADEGREFKLVFDGVFRNCQVWINGFYLGRHFSGYTGFSFDVADFLYYGGENTVVVRVDASQFEGWFYEGAGIYRNVWLEKHGPIHLAGFEPFIHATTRPPYNESVVHVSSGITANAEGRQEVAVQTAIYDNRGVLVAQTEKTSVDLANGHGYGDSVRVVQSNLWSVDAPYRYRAVVRLWAGERLVDERTIAFGIRDVRMDAQEGLFLNGKPLKVKGVCMHQDHAGVGAALPEYLQYYRVGLLKEMGANAYRPSPNPPSPELMEACDSLGMLVLAETRLMNSGQEYMGQLEDLVLQFRNHPSLFLWSIGNEEEEIHHTPQGRRVAARMIRRITELDPTRPVTYSSNLGNVSEGVNQIIPIRGFNYNLHGLDAYKKANPDQPILGTEVGSTVGTRGEYVTDSAKAYLADFDLNFPSWASTAQHWWTIADERPWFMGGFIWSGMDYRGEPTPFKWPNINSHFGVMDMCGFPKSVYYYYQAWWTDKDVLHIAPHWNWDGKEGQPISVWVNSNADEVELYLNGKSLGNKSMTKNGHLEWQVPYQPGTLKAVAKKAGRTFTAERITTGRATGLVLETVKERLLANGEDVTVIDVLAIDSAGNFVPDANPLIDFAVEGDGHIIGVGNGDPSSHEPDQYTDAPYRRRLFNGRCQVIVQAGKQGGEITLFAGSGGLVSAPLRMAAIL